MIGDRKVLVVGVPSGGTSAVAGVIHRLGFRMGRVFRRDSYQPAGTFEERNVAIPLRRIFDATGAELSDGDTDRVAALLRYHFVEAGWGGFKYPDLAHAPRAVEAGMDGLDWTLVWVERPVREAEASARRRFRGEAAGALACARRCRESWSSIAAREKVVVSFNDLVGNPIPTIDALARSLGVDADEELVSLASAFVRPEGVRTPIGG